MHRLLIKSYIPAIVLFIILNALFIILAERFNKWGFNTNVLLLGNLLLFLISAMSFLMGAKAMTTKSTHSFLRLVYGSFILKLVILAAAAFIYISIARKDVNKPALFFCMGLYIIYTFIEVNTLMKTVRKRING